MALISPSTVAATYGIPATVLRQWRQQGIGPEYFRFTARTVSYHDGYLRDWFNDPDNAALLSANPPADVDRSCRDGRVNGRRRRDDR